MKTNEHRTSDRFALKSNPEGQLLLWDTKHQEFIPGQSNLSVESVGIQNQTLTKVTLTFSGLATINGGE